MTLLSKFSDSTIWELKHRPKTVDEMILPDRIKKLFDSPEKLADTGNYLFTGQRGTGKTSLASCISDNSQRTTMYINFSLETGIDTIREKVMKFISTKSMVSGKKIIIGDEFDRLSIQGMDSLKSVIEEFSKNVNFIFISNHNMKVTPEVKSRVTELNFNFSGEESRELQKAYWKRICNILQSEGIKFDPKFVGIVVKKFFPDMRHIMNKLQELSKIYPELNT